MESIWLLQWEKKWRKNGTRGKCNRSLIMTETLHTATGPVQWAFTLHTSHTRVHLQANQNNVFRQVRVHLCGRHRSLNEFSHLPKWSYGPRKQTLVHSNRQFHLNSLWETVQSCSVTGAVAYIALCITAQLLLYKDLIPQQLLIQEYKPFYWMGPNTAARHWTKVFVVLFPLYHPCGSVTSLT